MSLAPEIKAFLEAGAAAGLPQVWEAPVDVIRKNTQSRPALAGPVEPVREVINRFIPGPTADLPIRIYRPTANSVAPAIVYFHGGGWVLNFLDIYDASLARLANQSSATIISVNYQKAPEHPFPTPFDDCYSALEWVIAHAEELQIDPARIGVAGDSAGANLASGVALKARDNNLSLAFQFKRCNGSGISTCKTKFITATLMRYPYMHNHLAILLQQSSLLRNTTHYSVTANDMPSYSNAMGFLSSIKSLPG
jgi:acetyl esterase